MFIVLYGVNNLGKSTQAKLLVERLRKEGYAAEYLKYPVYDLEPSGPLINEYLRGGNPDELSRREVQILYAFNRTQFEPMLEKKLTAGIHIVAEDYIGTGLAWGVATGVDKKFLTRLNCRLRPEDLAFVFDGERFIEATETNHRHETDLELLKKVRLAHQELGQEFGWIPVNANRPVETIHHDLWTEVQKHAA